MLAGKPRICMLVQLTACLVKTVVWFSFCGGLRLQNHGVSWPGKLLLFRHVSCAFVTKVKSQDWTPWVGAQQDGKHTKEDVQSLLSMPVALQFQLPEATVTQQTHFCALFHACLTQQVGTALAAACGG